MRCCPECGSEITGRSDKKFCTPYCKSSFHYRVHQNADTRFSVVDKQLKLNRRILKLYNKAGKAIVRTEELRHAGFDPKYFTNYWKNSKGEVYLFCYELGFLKKTENGKDKFVLVKWQDYMG
jgi:hypothetical protein